MAILLSVIWFGVIPKPASILTDGLAGLTARKIAQAAILLWSGLHGIQSLSSDAKLGLITSETAHELSNAMVGTIAAGIRDQTVE